MRMKNADAPYPVEIMVEILVNRIEGVTSDRDRQLAALIDVCELLHTASVEVLESTCLRDAARAVLAKRPDVRRAYFTMVVQGVVTFLPTFDGSLPAREYGTLSPVAVIETPAIVCDCGHEYSVQSTQVAA